MEIQTVSPSCVALLLHSGRVAPPRAAELVRSALTIWGLVPWESMELDLFPSEDDTLILARPSEGVRVELADWIRPYLGTE